MTYNGQIIGATIGVIAFLILLGLYFLRKYLRGPNFSENDMTQLRGKVVVITGGNTGIGLEVARDVYFRGAKTVILCRDTDKGQEAVKSILNELMVIGNDIDVYKLDLADLESVRNCAKAVTSKYTKIDILINNAGVMCCPELKTNDGFDLQFGTNHLGHFLLTELLMPSLINVAKESEGRTEGISKPRVVIVSSLAHTRGQIYWDDPNFMVEGSYSRLEAYYQSKLANVMHGAELSRRYPSVNVYSLHPGVVKTELARHIINGNACTGFIFKLLGFFIKDPFYGAQTVLYCTINKELEDKSGLYYSDCREAQPHEKATNKEDQKRLWEMSEAMVGLRT